MLVATEKILLFANVKFNAKARVFSVLPSICDWPYQNIVCQIV